MVSPGNMPAGSEMYAICVVRRRSEPALTGRHSIVAQFSGLSPGFLVDSESGVVVLDGYAKCLLELVPKR